MTDTITRRRLLGTLAALPAGLLAVRRARGQTPSEPLRLGLVLPRGASTAAVEQVRMGTELGLEEGNTFGEFFGKRLLLLAEEAGTVEEAGRVGAELVRKGGVVALLGGLDDPHARALRDVVAQHDALFLNLGGRADELRGAACHRRMFHLEGSDTMYAQVLATALVDRKKLRGWAILATDTPRGRGLRQAAAGAVGRTGGRILLEDRLPSTADGAFAASLDRAAKANADVVFLAMESDEQLAVVRAAKGAGRGVTLAGAGLAPGEFLSPDLAGVSGFWSTLWYHEWTRFSARELNRRFDAKFGKPMQGLGWTGWAGVRLLAEAAVRAEATEPAAWERFLAADYPFDGHKGEPLTFRPWDHQLRLTFGVVTPRPREAARGEADVYDTVTDNIPRDPALLDGQPQERRCRFGS